MRKLLATNNAGKVREFRALLSGCGWDLVTPAEAGLALEVEETGTTYVANARLKATAFAQAAGIAAIADDSGLEVDALDGAPGVYSARYAGQDTTHADKIVALLDAVQGVPEAERTGRFRAVLVAALPDGRERVAEGVCEGRIGHAPRGEGGFGYDPIFVIGDGLLTMAEISSEEKNRISHRAVAARAMCRMLRELADD
ncbi:MAG: RdgB/HAM1 family non-canonical purine NTP pyrophosphatase [Dehalococcoidia bacterium]